MIGVLITSFTWAGATIPDTKENSKTEFVSSKMVNDQEVQLVKIFTMQKAAQPTSQYQVFCDTFDMKGEVKIHKTDDGTQKLLLSLTSEDGEKTQSVSLFKEDAEMLAHFINKTTPYLKKRQPKVPKIHDLKDRKVWS
ncbi:hypothetical protein FNJ88_11100 [Chryseobacterium sp. SNU WT5]|nr:hypothetical protein FNJ88_11100 [Chryseobacterium sp. SNU WT5]